MIGALARRPGDRELRRREKELQLDAFSRVITGVQTRQCCFMVLKSEVFTIIVISSETIL